MKKFQFPLSRVLNWRETLARVEESKLEGLYAELRAIESREVELKQERARGEKAVATAASAKGSELAALDAFRRFAVAEHTRLEQRRADCARRIKEQMQVVAIKRRDVRLLEHLKQKRAKLWSQEFARDLENQAGEMFLAKWNRG